MRLRSVIKKLIALTVCITTLNVMSARSVSAQVEKLFPTHVVTIKPPYGYSSGRVRVRLSDSEWQVIKRLEPITALPEQFGALPDGFVTWKIENSAASSETLRLGIRALQDTRKIFALLGVKENPVTIVVARTQDFINENLDTLDCSPNLQLTKGIHVMGEAVCNHRVIVINLTGYFFYRYAGQTITPAMEARKEPALSNFSYLIVDRNISGLSHEWIHIVRGTLSEGFIPSDEPAWFREGFAEIVAGIARASSFNDKMNYRDFHVIRLRKFSVWPSRCLLPLRSYRSTASNVSGCEYLRGATAIELLVANYGGLEKVVNLYSDLVETNDFTTSFQRIYGMSLSSFEKIADRYANYINQAAGIKL